MLFGAEESVVAKIAEKLAANLLKYIDYILYGLLGLLVVLFVVGLVCALTNGELNAFKKLAKQYLGGQIKGETAVMKQMPVRLKKLYKRAKKTPARSAEIMIFSPKPLCEYAFFDRVNKSRI